jgi:hypothetical protein
MNLLDKYQLGVAYRSKLEQALETRYYFDLHSVSTRGYPKHALACDWIGMRI